MQLAIGFILGVVVAAIGSLIVRRILQQKKSATILQKKSTTILRPTPPTGLSGWVDVDRPQLGSLSWNQRIDYFEQRVTLVVLNPLRRILQTEIHTGQDSSALLIYGVSLCCAIEAVGRFEGGMSKTRSGDRFRDFVRDYMHSDFQTMLGTDTYANILWKYFRNGLAHGFAVKQGGC